MGWSGWCTCFISWQTKSSSNNFHSFHPFPLSGRWILYAFLCFFSPEPSDLSNLFSPALLIYSPVFPLKTENHFFFGVFSQLNGRISPIFAFGTWNLIPSDAGIIDWDPAVRFLHLPQSREKSTWRSLFSLQIFWTNLRKWRLNSMVIKTRFIHSLLITLIIGFFVIPLFAYCVLDCKIYPAHKIASILLIFFR